MFAKCFKKYIYLKFFFYYLINEELPYIFDITISNAFVPRAIISYIETIIIRFV